MKAKRKIGIIYSILIVLLVIILSFILFVYFYRFFAVKEIDDVTPEIACESKLLEKSDVLWVIPIFDNRSIAEDKAWCESILALNKTLGLHGVYHTYREFGQPRNQEYIDSGIDAFEECFGFKPEMFKAPQLYLSKENENTLENMGLVVKNKLNQLMHKVYHCSDTGQFSNKIIDWF